ncbi:unnamed protein product [Rhodiola kirilowii]
MQVEYDALLRNRTWTLVPPPCNANIIGCKWVYRIKRRADGTIERYKVRVVAKGFNQEEGVDYVDTFSPVVKPASICIVLAIALTLNWSLHQVDINNAFLNGDLSEKVYMAQPPGFLDQSHLSHVCLLQKALYGLKQAPRAWFTKLRLFLLDHGFVSCKSDTSLFIRRSGKLVLYILVYVDDLIITGSCSVAIFEFISLLNATFSLRDLGPLHYFLGIELVRHKSSIALSQQKYIRDLLHRSCMADAKHIASPAEPASRLVQTGDPVIDIHLYRSIVGALQYVTITHPEISFVVNRVCQFMHNPTDIHWSVVKRILRYLKGTIDLGLVLRSCTDHRLVAYSDAGWASDGDDCRSQHGFVIYYGDNLISWSSKKQQVVAKSSTEVEFRAIAFTATELIWLQQLLQELQAPLSPPPILLCDNLSATYMSANHVFHQRSKHIKIDYHFVREQVDNGSLIVRHVRSLDQIADIFTKAVGAARFATLRSKLHVAAPP